MLRQAFINFNESNLIVFGFLLFFLTFLGVLIWTFCIQKKEFYNILSASPFIDGEKREEKNGEKNE